MRKAFYKYQITLIIYLFFLSLSLSLSLSLFEGDANDFFDSNNHPSFQK